MENDKRRTKHITSHALKLFIGRCTIPLTQMTRGIREQRPLEPTWVSGMLNDMERQTTVEARNVSPLKLILQSKDGDLVRTIQRNQKLPTSVRFWILDGQHRHEAATQLIDKKKAAQVPILEGETVWNCEVYRAELFEDPNLPLLMLFHNNNLRTHEAMAATFFRTIHSMEMETTLLNPNLTKTFNTLKASTFWGTFLQWATHDFNKWATVGIWNGWHLYLAEGEWLWLVCKDSLKQISRLEMIKSTAGPLKTSDISLKEWTIKSNSKTGTRTAMMGHFKRRHAQSRLPFTPLPGTGRLSPQWLWAYAIRDEHIYGNLLWACNDFDLKPPSAGGKTTVGQARELVFGMRHALSLLAVLLYGESFGAFELDGAVFWFKEMTSRAGVEYNLDGVEKVLRLVAKSVSVPKSNIKKACIHAHVYASKYGVQETMSHIQWDSHSAGVWRRILTECSTALGIQYDTAVWQMVMDRVSGALAPKSWKLLGLSVLGRETRNKVAKNIQLFEEEHNEDVAGEPDSHTARAGQEQENATRRNEPRAKRLSKGGPVQSPLDLKQTALVTECEPRQTRRGRSNIPQVSSSLAAISEGRRKVRSKTLVPVDMDEDRQESDPPSTEPATSSMEDGNGPQDGSDETVLEPFSGGNSIAANVPQDAQTGEVTPGARKEQLLSLVSSLKDVIDAMGDKSLAETAFSRHQKSLEQTLSQMQKRVSVEK
ncbi:hypothetical protein M408DRAFT_24653 [Serendipita vermifera MAFF 305830]|uniref:Uncharacterized protein n=1 Tax=Serendipita vermifera MAFF 305830 TaxID=933852 RepID=A0A0C3B7J7_SERVB|nr:hypothetical protein M408DRAFT_24653 [Serendipita vermifera MAFF 305830]